MKDFAADFLSFVFLCFIVIGCMALSGAVFISLGIGWVWILGLLPGWAQFIANTLLVVIIVSLIGATIEALHRTEEDFE